MVTFGMAEVNTSGSRRATMGGPRVTRGAQKGETQANELLPFFTAPTNTRVAAVHTCPLVLSPLRLHSSCDSSLCRPSYCGALGGSLLRLPSLKQLTSAPLPSTMPYCDRCNRSFGSQYALQQHIDHSSSHHHVCDDCHRDFATAEALVQHYTDDSRHAYCASCDKRFDDFDDLDIHYNEDHYYDWCGSCTEVRTVSFICAHPADHPLP